MIVDHFLPRVLCATVLGIYHWTNSFQDRRAPLWIVICEREAEITVLADESLGWFCKSGTPQDPKPWDSTVSKWDPQFFIKPHENSWNQRGALGQPTIQLNYNSDSEQHQRNWLKHAKTSCKVAPPPAMFTVDNSTISTISLTIIVVTNHGGYEPTEN